MTDIQIFENTQFGKIRTVIIDGVVWFAGKDVAEILGYAVPQKAIRDHVEDVDKITVTQKDLAQMASESKGTKTEHLRSDAVFSIDSPRGMIFINESGLYSLTLSSKLPKAREFRHWVTSEVLPAVYKFGLPTQKPVTIIDALEQTLSVLKAQSQEIQAIKVVQDEQKLQIEDIKRAINPTDLLKPVKKRYLYTNGLVHRISQLTFKSHGEIWLEVEAELNKEFDIDLSAELEQAKIDYERYYYNQCIGRGGARNVPKSVKRPSAIKNISLNQIISANPHWYQMAKNILCAMKNDAVESKNAVEQESLAI